jgi:antitoxin HicB
VFGLTKFAFVSERLPGAAIDFSRRGLHTVSMKYRVVIEPDEDGIFVAECPALPGCISQGKTRAEALANIKDAMTGYLESLKKHGELATV